MIDKQKIVEEWEKIKKRHPDKLNIEGLESALTSDIYELIDFAIQNYQTEYEQKHIASAVEVARKEERERIIEGLLVDMSALTIFSAEDMAYVHKIIKNRLK